MLILGIDPGFAIVGFGLVEADRGRQRLVQCGAITTPAGEPLPARLRQIADDMDLLLAQFQPQAMAVEELFFNNNITTGIGVAQARGVLLLAAERRGVPIFEYTPSQVKQAVVGYGKAEKRQVMDMTRRLLNLSAVPKPDDAADAVAPTRPARAAGAMRCGNKCVRRSKNNVLLSERRGGSHGPLSGGHRLRRGGLCLPHHQQHPVPSAKGEAGQALYPPECP